MPGAVIIDDSGEIRQALDFILSRREFSHLAQQTREGFLQELLDRVQNSRIYQAVVSSIIEVFQLLFRYLSSPGGQLVALVVSMLFLGLAVGAVIFFVLRRVAPLTGSKKTLKPEQSIMTDPAGLRRQGIELGQQGKYRRGAGLLYESFLLQLDCRGILAKNSSRTHREVQTLLETLQKPEFMRRFSRMNRAFEELVYSGMDCDDSCFKSFLEDFDYCWREADSFG